MVDGAGAAVGVLRLLRAEGDDPVLVLDDVFAELDTTRRQRLADMVADAEQVVVTAAVAEDIPTTLSGVRFTVDSGQVKRDPDETPEQLPDAESGPVRDAPSTSVEGSTDGGTDLANQLLAQARATQGTSTSKGRSRRKFRRHRSTWRLRRRLLRCRPRQSRPPTDQCSRRRPRG